MNILDSNVRNPHYHWLYFPYEKAKNHVDILLLYTEIYSGDRRDHDNYKGEMASNDIDALCNQIKAELNLKVLDWGYVCGKCLVWCDLDDFPKIYEITNAFLTRGRRVYMNDQTQVTFNPGQVASPETQQQRLCETLSKLEGYGMTCHDLCSLPVHRSNFWNIPEGKAFAEQLRRKHNLPDVRQENEYWIGEYFAEVYKPVPVERKVCEVPDEKMIEDFQVASNRQLEKMEDLVKDAFDVIAEQEKVGEKKEVDPEDKLCLMCAEHMINTMVLPCMHCVICQQCSKKLSYDSINSTICIICRQHIDEIIDI